MGVGFRGNGSLLGPRSASRLNPRAAQIDTVLLDSERRLSGVDADILAFGAQGFKALGCSRVYR